MNLIVVFSHFQTVSVVIDWILIPLFAPLTFAHNFLSAKAVRLSSNSSFNSSLKIATPARPSADLVASYT